jgi:hypothetical protein
MGFRKRLLATALSALACTAFTPPFVFAYDHPLSDETIRRAYFIGQDVRNVNTFLSRYTQALPVPDTGPHIAEIELATPYAQVVENSSQHTVGYSAQDAEADYRKRGDLIVVRVRVLFTPRYSGDSDFWHSVSVGLIQRGKHLAATASAASLSLLRTFSAARRFSALTYSRSSVSPKWNRIPFGSKWCHRKEHRFTPNLT